MSELETRLTKMMIVNKGEPIYHESAISVEVVDDGAGELLQLSQSNDDEYRFKITKCEWPALRGLIDDMFERHVRDNEN